MRTEKGILKYSPPDPSTQTINVIRQFPDGKEEVIGQIHAEYDSVSDSITYSIVDIFSGEQLPSTTDFSEIDRHFEQIAFQKIETELHKSEEEMIDEYYKRSNVLKKIRQFNSKTFNKLLTR